MTRKSTEVILAIDCDNMDEARRLVELTHELISIFKIGSILFTAYGPPIVEMVKAMGRDVFLDLKFHDIPNTVRGAVRTSCSLGVKMVTIHTAGGLEMLKAACLGAEEGCRQYSTDRPLLIGVTQLTSMGTRQGLHEEVLKLANFAFEAGLDGVVCSAKEVAAIRQAHGDELLTVVPGIRLKQDSSDDQARVATPIEATKAGADFIVVGRSVTRSSSPLEKLRKIKEEISRA